MPESAIQTFDMKWRDIGWRARPCSDPGACVEDYHYQDAGEPGLHPIELDRFIEWKEAGCLASAIPDDVLVGDPNARG